ncbi:hypothetical protein CsSME_00013862 [Camellia sinensis var. sinensis]
MWYGNTMEKLRQTRELYATFNAMSEIKELMLKKTSLLNSISSQSILVVGGADGTSPSKMRA